MVVIQYVYDAWGNHTIGTYAICVGMSMIPVPGARVVSGITAGMIFIVDLFS